MNNLNNITRKFKRILALSSLLSVFACVKLTAQTNVYVDPTASGANNGTSWANAYTNLNTAMADANAGSGTYSIYVTQGTYYATAATLTSNPNPTSSPSSINYAFCIKREGIKIYGGYSYGGSSRNPKATPTILNANGNYRALIIAGANSPTDSVIVDGVSITGSYNYTGLGSSNVMVNGITIFNSQGGGANINSSNAPLLFREVTFYSNTGGYGGGAFVYAANTTFKNCIFSNNITAGGPGGGIGVFASTVNIFQCLFANNSAAGYSLASGGGLYVGATSNVNVYNSTFSNNTAPGSGGTGLSVLQDAGAGVLTIKNSILWSADATKNVTLGTYDITYSDVRQPSSPITGTGNINSDPLFANASDPDGTDNLFATADDGNTLGNLSPSRDAGNNIDVPSGLVADITGSGRIYPAIVDMGAYEGGVIATSNCTYPNLNLFASAGAVSYSWTGPNGFNSSQQNPVITNAGSAEAGTYTVTATSAAGFTSTGTTTVVMSTWYQDLDGDGKGNAAVTLYTCTQPAGYVSNSLDCNDNAPAVYTPATAVLSGSGAICHGTSKSLSIVCTGTGPFSGTLSDGTTFSGATSPVTVNVSPVVATTTYTIATFADVYNACPPAYSGSATVTVTGIPPTTTGGSTTGPGTVNLSAAGSGVLNWYDDPTAGNLVSTGSAYSPFISSTQTYYVSNTDGGISNYSVGLPSPVLNTAITLSNRGLNFSVSANCVLTSVTIYPAAAGSGSIVVRTGATTVTTVAFINTAAEINLPKVITLNTSLTAGSSYNIIRTGSASLKYESSGSSYPYTVAGSPVSITSANPTSFVSYYYFYNWQVNFNNQCISSRTPVTATYLNNNVTWYLDADNDGWYVNTQLAATSPGTGWTSTLPANGSGDCDDNIGAVHPGATEILCNGIDENCNGMSDDGTPSVSATGATSDALSDEICTGGSVNITLHGGLLGTGAIWNWYAGSCGGTPVGTGNSISVSPTSTTTYYVRAEGSCNTTACTSATITVKINGPAGTVQNIITPPSACVNGNIGASVPLISNTTFYVWNGPAGTTFNGIASPARLTTNAPSIVLGSTLSSGWTICVQGENACGVTTNTKCAFIRGAVSQPVAIIGSDIACANSSESYTIADVTGADLYEWTMTGDATVSGTGTTGSVIFGPTFTSGTLCVRAKLSCGTGSAYRCMTISNLSTMPSAITGAATACPSTSSVYSIPAVDGAVSYNWTASCTGATIINNGTSATVTFPTSFSSCVICVTANSACGVPSASRCKSISTAIPGTPSAITGNLVGICASTQNYTCPSVAGATSYSWTISGGIGTITFGQGTNAISVNWNGSGTSGTLSVAADNGCGIGGARTVNIRLVPGVNSGITGDVSVACNSAGNYTAGAAAGAAGYNWSILPAGPMIVPMSNSAIIDFNGKPSGNYTVYATSFNACGNGNTQTFVTNHALCVRMAHDLASGSKLEVSAYPNPAYSLVTVNFNSSNDNNYTVKLVDLSSRVVYNTTGKSLKGNNVIDIDLSSLAKGVYMLQLNNGSEQSMIRLVVE